MIELCEIQAKNERVKMIRETLHQWWSGLLLKAISKHHFSPIDKIAYRLGFWIINFLLITLRYSRNLYHGCGKYGGEVRQIFEIGYDGFRGK